LTNFRTLTRDEWYTASHGGNEFLTEKQEFALYRSCGVNLHEVEKRLVLKPGDLLVVNNVRTIHGRIGGRPPATLRQILFGIPNAPRNTLAQISSRVLRLFAQDPRATRRGAEANMSDRATVRCQFDRRDVEPVSAVSPHGKP